MTQTQWDDAKLENLLPAVIEIAEAAGKATLTFFRANPEVMQKEDKTPVTQADYAAEEIILDGLSRLTPDIPAISEEAAASAGEMPPAPETFWLVDPLDGTREFIAGRDEFTVNIALITGRRPILGVVVAPARALTYAGYGSYAIETTAMKTRQIQSRIPPSGALVVVASRSHRSPGEDAYLKGLEVASIVSTGSSLKFCLIATGEADLYPRFGPTMEWDTAAGHAVLNAAGGSAVTAEGSPLLYGKSGYRNSAFVASGQSPS